MSPTAVAARARPQPEVESYRASLRLVASRPLTAARLPFAIFIGSILAGGLVALLLLHTMAAQDAFRLQSLQQQSSALDDTEEQLAVANQQQAAPAALGARARALGMVSTGSIAYVELHHHGKILGVVQAASPPPPPTAPSPSPSPSAKATATAASKPSASSKPTTTHQRTTTKPSRGGHHHHG